MQCGFQYLSANDIQVVDEISARLGVEEELPVPIDADHRRICKFNNPCDPQYLPVLAELRRCVEKATRKSGISANSIPANGISGMAGLSIERISINKINSSTTWPLLGPVAHESPICGQGKRTEIVRPASVR